jgi:Na+-transporting methylmalonyl-CoA/oxaloacetate decarboxylase gamma subunit
LKAFALVARGVLVAFCLVMAFTFLFLIIAYVVFWISKVASKFSKTPTEPEAK